jgi:pilus assembly protein Flp/PilA
VFTTLRSMIRNDEGATLVESSLVVALIAVAAIVAMTTLGSKVSALFTSMGDELGAA